MTSDSSPAAQDNLAADLLAESRPTLEESHSLPAFKRWIHALPATQLEKMRQAIVDEEKIRAEQQTCDRFMNFLEAFESCFATDLRYSAVARVPKEGFRTTLASNLKAYASIFSDYMAIPANQTPLGFLKFVVHNPNPLDSLFVFWDGQNIASALFSEGSALHRYLCCFVLTDAGLSPVSPQCAFHALDENDADLKKYANPVWLERIRAADATFALSKIQGGVDALTQVYLAAIQAQRAP